MDYSNPLLLQVRSFLGRRLGILRPMVRLSRRIRNANYEESFDTALMRSIYQGCVVWDIGANDGFYTERCANAVGSGTVVAFEPSPRTFERLRERFANTPNVRLENLALGEESGEAPFHISEQSVTDGLFKKNCDPRSVVTVKVTRADDYRSQSTPNIVKIDVEGFELEVLRGMSALLRSEELKHVFVEVHFKVLSERGLQNAPRVIVKTLSDVGLSVKWLDPSHLVASRAAVRAN